MSQVETTETFLDHFTFIVRKKSYPNSKSRKESYPFLNKTSIKRNITKSQN